MKKIGLLSDTHGYWDDKFETYFETCDEIWHAGDIGSLELASRFEEMKPFRAVYGNIDDYKTRIAYPQTLRFTLEKVEVLMTHIGGYPGRYDPSIRAQLQARPPKLFIAGHSQYPEGTLRQETGLPPHEPRCGGQVWLPPGANAAPLPAG